MKRLIFIFMFLFSEIHPSNGQGWYHNLEKYWWYHYRLVNDFMYIDPNDCAGCSIPAQKRNHTNPATLDWEDATIELGHYIGALAMEYRILKDNNWDTWRTEYELHYALKAFERLDKNAETMCDDIDHHFPNSPATWTTPFPAILNNATTGSLNGFFLRDDVPFNNSVSSGSSGYWDFVSQHNEHFNRRGIWYNTALPSYSTSLSPFSCNVPGIVGSSATNKANFLSGSSFWLRTPAPSGWPLLTPRYPSEESQDQVVGMFDGLALATNFLDYNVSTFGMDLRRNAADAEYRIISWIPKVSPYSFIEDIVPNLLMGHPSCMWMLRNPLTQRCVYCGYETSYLYNQCIASGAWGPCTYAWSASRGVAKSAGKYYLKNYLVPSNALEATTLGGGILHKYYYLFQAQQFIPINQANKDVTFTDAYSAVSGSWQVPVFPPPFTALNTNNAWNVVVKHATQENFNSPHLPLIYRLNFKKPGLGKELTVGMYTNLLDYAPECGPSHYLGVDYKYREDKDWTGSDRLAEWYHRDGFGYTSIGSNDCDWNGIDYMMLFNLYSYQKGDYLSYIINPYYMRNYNVDYPDGSFGVSTNPLTLNWLEYLSAIDKINPGANVTFRGGKEIELIPGFEAETSSIFEAKIQDYVCSTESQFHTGDGFTGDSYHFAEDLGGPFEYSPTHLPYVMPVYADSDIINSNREDSLNSIPIPPEVISNFRDSLLYYIKNTGDTDMQNYLINMGLMDSAGGFIKNTPIMPEPQVDYKNLADIYPNPTTDRSTISLQLIDMEHVTLQITNALGQDVSNVADHRDEVWHKGKYNIVVHSEQLSPGVYFITIRIGEQNFIKKLIRI